MVNPMGSYGKWPIKNFEKPVRLGLGWLQENGRGAVQRPRFRNTKTHVVKSCLDKAHATKSALKHTGGNVIHQPSIINCNFKKMKSKHQHFLLILYHTKTVWNTKNTSKRLQKKNATKPALPCDLMSHYNTTSRRVVGGPWSWDGWNYGIETS